MQIKPKRARLACKLTDIGEGRATCGAPTKGMTHDSSELQLVERIRKRVALPSRTGTVLGIGDDCAIFRPRGASEDLVFTTDMLIEDVHFRRGTHRAADVGWKALARGLSDIAAMGAEPRFCLLSLALTPWADARWVDRFYDGLLLLAAREQTALLGGDLAQSDRMMCDIVVCGAVARGKALRRDGAREGDAIYVSGKLGGSIIATSNNYCRSRIGSTAGPGYSSGQSGSCRRARSSLQLRGLQLRT